MPIEILMPALSPTMTEGTLAAWSVKEGDKVASGDVIAEIETDKATMEVEAVDEGTIAKIVVPAGTEGVAVNAVIAVLLEEDEDGTDLSSFKPNEEKIPVQPEEAKSPAIAEELPVAAQTNEQVTSETVTKQSGDRLFASPLAKRLAEQAGYNLSDIRGSGPKGRIVKRDVEAHRPTASTTKPPSVSRSLSGPSAKELADLLGTTYREEPVSKIRGIIANRLQEAKQTIPHFYLTIECELDALLAMRKQINDSDENIKVSVNDLIIKASAKALIKVPEANASWNGDSILYYDHADVAVAVAIEGGLVTPIVRSAESKSLTTISDEMKDLAGRAKTGKLKPDEYQGGSLSISNLGMFGIKEFSAVINPPHGAILAVGMGEKRPVVKDGELAIATMMSCTLSCDHRVVDGAVGATFLQAFKGMIENPLGMLI